MIRPPEFDDLQANLREIYSALKAKRNGEELPLYAPGPNHVVYQNTLSGMLAEKWDKTWRYFQPSLPSHSIEDVLKSILTIFFNHAVHKAYDGRQRRIWHHMRQIDQLQPAKLSPLDNTEQRKRYVKHLAKELKGSIEKSTLHLLDFDIRASDPFAEEEERNHRLMITRFHQATIIFWSLFVKNDDVQLRHPLLSYIDDQKSTLLDRPLYKALKKEGRWMQIEAMMRQPIPVALMSKLHDPDNLTVDEKRRLRSWVQTLNECQGTISLKLLSIVLQEVIAIIHLQGSSPLTMQELLYWLDSQGCVVLHGEDAAHMVWRGGLNTGDTITCNGKELILGDLLSPDKPIDDEFKVFELANYPDYVVKIANNRFRLLIEEKQAQNADEHWGVRLVKRIENLEEDDKKPPIDGLDHEGRCVVLEKLSSPLSGMEWTSDTAELTEEDEKYALVLANHIFCMHQWKANAQNLSLSHLMFDPEGVLKSVRLLKKGPPNYNEWEAHCAAASQDNPFILAFLMNVSKLSEHKVALYYRGAVEHALQAGETDLGSRPLPMGHRQPVYDKRVKELCKQALELRRMCLKHVIDRLCRKKEYKHQQEGALLKQISERLVQIYKASPTPGILSTDLILAKVVESFLEPTWQDPVLDDSDQSAYYKEKYELMMSYNQALIKNAPEPQEKEKPEKK